MRTLAALALVVALPAAGAQCAARTGPRPGALVELYTSEGCDSCPRADRWLAGLPVADAGAGVVAIAFHVDYWDHLGWKDRFASPAWSDRQREAVRRGGGRFAYTPQVMLNGRDFPRWFSGSAFAEALSRAGSAPPAVDLSVRATRTGTALRVEAGAVRRDGRAAELDVFVALAESRLVSEVAAGENEGARLAHEHVARSLAGLGRLGADGRLDATHVFTLAPGWKAGDLAVVAFAADGRTGEVVQALRLGPCD